MTKIHEAAERWTNFFLFPLASTLVLVHTHVQIRPSKYRPKTWATPGITLLWCCLASETQQLEHQPPLQTKGHLQ